MQFWIGIAVGPSCGTASEVLSKRKGQIQLAPSKHASHVLTRSIEMFNSGGFVVPPCRCTDEKVLALFLRLADHERITLESSITLVYFIFTRVIRARWASTVIDAFHAERNPQ